jgi:hypothetical protein
MSASKHIEVHSTFRGNATRIGGALAGVVLTWALQPVAVEAQARSQAHFSQYSELLAESGIHYGFDTNGDRPGDQALVAAAHAELAAGNHWQDAMIGIEVGSLVLWGAALTAGMVAAKRQETTDAVWQTVTRAVPVGQ